MDQSYLWSRHDLCSLAGIKSRVYSGVAQLRSGAFYSLLFTALVMDRLGEKILKSSVRAKRPNLAPIVEGSSSDDTSQGCAEATHSGQDSKPVDTAAKQLSSTTDIRGKYRPITRDQALMIRAKYNDGQSVSKIAKEFGVSRWACYKIINFRSHADKWET